MKGIMEKGDAGGDIGINDLMIVNASVLQRFPWLDMR